MVNIIETHIHLPLLLPDFQGKHRNIAKLLAFAAFKSPDRRPTEYMSKTVSNQICAWVEWTDIVWSGWTPLPGVTEFRWKWASSKGLLEVLTQDSSHLRISACVTLPETNSNSFPLKIGIFCLQKNVYLPTMPKCSRAKPLALFVFYGFLSFTLQKSPNQTLPTNPTSIVSCLEAIHKFQALASQEVVVRRGATKLSRWQIWEDIT